MAKLVYILSNSYSGSTLFDLVLGNQNSFRSLGEIHRIASPAAQRLMMHGNRCSCGSRLSQCAYWESAREAVLPELGYAITDDWSVLPFASSPQYYQTSIEKLSNLLTSAENSVRFSLTQKLSPAEIHRGHAQWYFYDALANHFGAEVLVDSSKSVSPLIRLALTRPQAVHVVRLIRDGRGVLNSMMKRDTTGRSAKAFVKAWCRESKRLDRVKEKLSNLGVATHTLKYEEFCRQPKSELTPLLSGVSDAFSDSFEIERDVANHHIIPGNPMSTNPIIKIRLDERWKDQLKPESLSAFKRYGEKLNISYGYY